MVATAVAVIPILTAGGTGTPEEERHGFDYTRVAGVNDAAGAGCCGSVAHSTSGCLASSFYIMSKAL